MPKYYVASCRGTRYHGLEGVSPKDVLIKFLIKEKEIEKENPRRFYIARQGVIFNIKSRNAWTFKVEGNDISKENIEIKHRGILYKKYAEWMTKGLPPHYIDDWTDLEHTGARFM